MKKIVFIAMLLPSAAFANPYLGFEYGLGSVDHDYQPVVEGKTLNPKMDGGVMGGFIGYQFNDSWAVEFGYREYKVDDSIEVELIELPHFDEREKDWEAEGRAKQLSIMPIYRLYSNQNWKVNVGAGISYTMYDTRSSYSETIEPIIGPERPVAYTGAADDFSQWGGIVSTSLNYLVTPQLSLGAEAKYQIDDYANLASLSFKMAYKF